ncbi:hypothetical protein AMATHDRAFT_53168 [Amanita thiersii Skay4041]|uniref:BRCT domain-containing protein n=1 Tax=Amanita thiersii Skay4041 TaxID=703135 RepID=A0A2A9P0Z3_9AGAR|nr:hypothetical protein AMATHDRAFT_53168 [Amanita thiersii Skay4041]
MEHLKFSSDTEDSQASQLIQNVLDHASSSSLNVNRHTHLHSNNKHDSISNDSTADSSLSSRNTLLTSQYLSHGLAESQSHAFNQVEVDEGSQKENFTRDTFVSPSSHPFSITKNPKSKARYQEPARLHSGETEVVKPKPITSRHAHTKAGDHLSKIVHSGLRNNKPSSRSRSSSKEIELSQTSFGVDTTDLERRFLASAPQFQVPLSELVDRRSLSPVVRKPQGRILVSATPSDSEENQTPVTKYNAKEVNQQYNNNAMPLDDDSISQHSNSSSTPGSSLYDSRNAEQPAEGLQATQPSTQHDESEVNFLPNSDWLLSAAPKTSSPGGSNQPKGDTVPEATSSTSGGRSLLGMVDRNNKWRYQRCQELIRRNNQAATTNGSIAAQQNSVVQEVSTTYEAEAELPPSVDSRKTSTVPPHLRRDQMRNQTAPKDTMDVVPDSEPSREEVSSLALNEPAPRVDDAGGTRVRKQTRESDRLSGDDEEEDIPLAKVAPKLERRPKASSRAAKAPLVNVPKISSRMEPAEVPSSVPEQDAHLATPLRSLRSRPGNFRSTKSGRNQVRKFPSASNQNRVKGQASDEEVKASTSESENLDTAPGPVREQTEPAEEEYQEADNAASSRKRKRGVLPTKIPPVAAKGSVTRGAKAPRSGVLAQAPSGRQTKRMRSMTSSTAKITNSEATRVFALWRQDGHYYAGTVHSLQPDSRYLIKFDDNTEAIVNLEQMRLCKLRPGDDVLLQGRTRSSKVLDSSKMDNDLVVVDIDGETEKIDISLLRIASRTIKSAWKNRLLITEDITPVISPIKAFDSPTPSGVSLASAQSGKSIRKKFLSKTGFIVTVSAGNGNWEKEKESLLTTIKDSGGIVFDDWATGVRMEGKHAYNNNRWVLNKDEVQWCSKEDIERIFLLADDASQKPKFLIALALGVPCLSVNWLHDSVLAGEEKEWSAYLLPQGYSDTLSARISQQVDVDWGNSVHQLTDIMDNTVPAKVLQNKSILCVGIDMVPQPKGKRLVGTDEKAQEASNAVARIIMCMGPQRVEAVTELRYASAHPSNYDYIVAKDPSSLVADLTGCIVVSWAWVKDCLIASRQLPLPLLQQEESSQEA